MSRPRTRRKKPALEVLAACALAAVAAFAEPPAAAQPPKAASDAPSAAASAVMTWLSHLSEGLSESSLPVEPQSNIAAVAAVRGAPQSTPSLRSPAWIGGIEARKAALLKSERLELKRDVDLGLGGKIREALKALREFEKNHPTSPLVPEAIKARANLRRLERLQPAAKKGSDAKPPQKGSR